MHPLIADILRGFGTLLPIQLAFAVASWALLRATVGRAASRSGGLLLLLAGYHVAVAIALDIRVVRAMDIGFFAFHLAYVFRFLSSIYFHRAGETTPSLGFHVLLVTIGPRQHYGAGGWQDLKGRRVGWPLLAEWARHLGHAAVVAALCVFFIVQAGGPAVVFQGLARGEVATAFGFIPAVGCFAIIGLMVLTVIGDLVSMVWGLGGYHMSFFGRFPFFRSRHAGQFWWNWNTHAVRAFRELSGFLRLRRHLFANTMAVFAASGFLHQVTVYYYTRRLSYGTFLAFLAHGLAVYASAWLFHKSARLPTPVRWLLFNPITTLAVILPISAPMALDFY